MKIHALLAASCIAASICAQASNPLQPVELSDQELSQLRGRFVMPGHIVHFGVTMSSVWENASGQVLAGAVHMQASEGMFQPQFNVSTITRNGDHSAPPAGSGQIQGGEGLSSINGVAQSVRAAGDFNSASNNFVINVKRGGSAPNTANTGQQFANQIEATQAGNVQISASDGGFRIAINALGQGSSLQQLGGGGLQQHANIGGAGNMVRNLTALDVLLRDTPVPASSIGANLDHLRALRPAGY
ncbi:hypothetical protein SAMN05216229_106217 [Geopseudomonas sagittaria]|uniref:Fap system outer membrane protein n=1 Tax=Geopseudomonas sagittaria TaxID=1135990 RepID=A0A1I5TNS7_9GAMM|nr:hypothetical protein [Pseudomonas sagittaria]SFP84754.1 hypothetical protein SAMN05216229_106217 [Pseudomonas sagittaria]